MAERGLDRRGEGETLTEAMGGTYARMGGDSTFRINLLQLPEGFHQMEARERRYVVEAKTRLVMQLLMSVLGPAAEEAEELEEILVHGLVQVYEKHAAPRQGSLYRELGEIQQEGGRAGERAGRLRMMLSPYVVDEQGRAGIWAQDFDVERSDEVGLAPVVCFDLIDAKKNPERFRALALLALSWVYDRMQRRDGVERQFVADEAWALLNQEASGRMLEMFFREARTMGASPALVAQGEPIPHDFK